MVGIVDQEEGEREWRGGGIRGDKQKQHI